MIIDSPYLFDNLEPIDQLHAKPVELIQKNIPSEQWNSLDYTDTSWVYFSCIHSVSTRKK